jgi:hypothetical protein
VGEEVSFLSFSKKIKDFGFWGGLFHKRFWDMGFLKSKN